jgi:hypothetical protein
MKTESLINKLQEFLNDHDIKIDQELLSASLKELNFTKTLSLLDMMKDRDMPSVAELLNIKYDAPVTEEESPWTTTGKHPEDMDADELRDELAVFDELRDRGDYLSPQELAREDTLFDYLEQIDGPQVDEAYGTVGTQQPSASTIKAQTTKDNNNQRDFTNAQQNQQRDATVTQRTVAGGNKQPTGQGAARSVGADPDDVQRGQNAAQANANAQLSNQNAAEIERLKALAFGRR